MGRSWSDEVYDVDDECCMTVFLCVLGCEEWVGDASPQVSGDCTSGEFVFHNVLLCVEWMGM